MHLSKRTTPILFTTLISILLLSAIPMTYDVSALSSYTIVSTELINFYSMTSTEVRTFVQTIDDQGMSMLTLRLNAMYEFQSGSSSGINKAKEVIQQANSLGIQVCIDLHTWFTTWDNYFRDSATKYATYRSQYIKYVKNVLSVFSGSNVYAFMVMNEPQARKATSSENNFILDVISAAKEVTSRPVSVRFMGGYSPTTGHYSSEIDKASDFLCRNTYWDPRNPSASVYGTTEAKLNTAISTAHSQDKSLWITEFGKSKSNLESQRSYVEAFVSWSKSKGVDAIFCWVSQPESGNGENYNIFNGDTPNPAFYELVNDVQSPPMPEPEPEPEPDPEPYPTLLSDGFESGSFARWDGTIVTSGEAVTVSETMVAVGSYSAKFRSNGGRSYENAYCYENLASLNNVRVSGSFYVSESGINSDNDRFYFMMLRSGNNGLAYAGWKRTNGVVRWTVTLRDGTIYTDVFSTSSPTTGRWYDVELHWLMGRTGMAELTVNGVVVVSATKNTSVFGGASVLQFGLSELYDCARTTVYGDQAVVEVPE